MVFIIKLSEREIKREVKKDKKVEIKSEEPKKELQE